MDFVSKDLATLHPANLAADHAARQSKTPGQQVLDTRELGALDDPHASLREVTKGRAQLPHFHALSKHRLRG